MTELSGPKARGYQVIDRTEMEPAEATADTVLGWARANGHYREGAPLEEILEETNAARERLGLPGFALIARSRVESPMPSPHFGDLSPNSYSKKARADA